MTPKYIRDKDILRNIGDKENNGYTKQIAEPITKTSEGPSGLPGPFPR